jgi:FlaA1/EpsC-like NDP-sugar epimerase
LVTGAGGSIGSELCYQLSKVNVKKIIALDSSELSIYNLQKKLFNKKKIDFILGNILDKKLIKNIYNKYKIDIIFHAAAFKHVNILENNIYQAIKNNVYGTMNLLNCLNGRDTSFILISTDKAAKPTSILGMTKRIAEITVQTYFQNYKISVVRFGNVFGSQGSAINLFIEQINNGGPITLTNKKVKRFFMSTKEACNLVMLCPQLKSKSRIFILNMGKPLLLWDIVKKLIDQKKEREPSFKIDIKETGLKSGEKIEEILTSTNKLYKTIHPEIFSAKEPIYSRKSLDLFFSKLENYFNNLDNKKLKLCMKSFLKKEL